ncbi:MAG: 16S rRNA (uracil(1498)-N(3))-methyltransferase [Leptolyngbyaceae cyanobacterium]
MQRIVVNPVQITGNCLTLTAAQQHYLQRVLRLKGGDRFLALDGQGQVWQATLQATGTHAEITVCSEISSPPLSAAKVRLTLAACLPKQGFDEVVRQATELGVDEIVPILSDRTLLKPSAHKLQRWQRIAAEAGEQSERLLVPHVREPIDWSHWSSQESQDYRLICVARRAAPSLLSVCLTTPLTAVQIAVGPEGGWTESEMAQAIAQGYQPVTLGGTVLRAVTASVTALGILQAGINFVTMYSPIDTTL